MSDIARFTYWDCVLVRYDDHRAEVERLTVERDAAQAEVERLKEQVAALTVAVEQADEAKADAEAAAAREEAETDRVMVERDAARAEVERLKAGELNGRRATNQRIIAERDAAQAEVERLRANGQAILDRSRPTDEDIWRQAFTATLQSPHFNRTKMADEVLAEYRKRWPR